MSGCNQKNEEAAIVPAKDGVAPADQERTAIFVKYFGNSCAQHGVIEKIREMARSYRDASTDSEGQALLVECNHAIRAARELKINVPEGIENYLDPDAA